MLRTLTLSSVLGMLVPAFGQQELFVESFEGAEVLFDVNTSDVGSGVGANTWLINDVFLGGNGIADCLGFELPFTIPSTAGQPAGISTPNGNYLHTASTVAIANGIENCSFGAADGFCTDPGNHFARMNMDVNTIGQGDITLSFWWLCLGGASNYGEVYYSTDGGTVWTQITTPIAQYSNQSAWGLQTISLPVFAEQSSLRFGFRFVNNTSFAGGSDPGFGIDDIRMVGEASVPAEITTGVVPESVYCMESSFLVPYSVQGSFGPGNAFTAELSDATGSFAAPTVIGSVLSTSAGSIPCALPGGLPAGIGYRIRVVANMPAIIGSVSGSDISIVQPSNAGSNGQSTYCNGSDPIPLFTLLGGTPDACGTWVSPDAIVMSGLFDPSIHPAGVYTYTTDCAAPCPADMATVTMQQGTGLGAGNDVNADVCAEGGSFTPYAYVDGGETNGQFWYAGAPFPLPDFSMPGVYALDYIVQSGDGCPTDTALFEFTVIEAPNAGSGLSHTLCFTAAPLDLLTLLPGADMNGVWTGPSGGAFSGVLDPAVGISGIYTYTVAGEDPCEDDHSFIAIVIDPCIGIAEQQGADATIHWLGGMHGAHRFQLPENVQGSLLGVLDAQGRMVVEPSTVRLEGRILVDLSDRAPGVYFALFRLEQRDVMVRLLHTNL
jgi:hypothetical protein